MQLGLKAQRILNKFTHGCLVVCCCFALYLLFSFFLFFLIHALLMDLCLARRTNILSEQRDTRTDWSCREKSPSCPWKHTQKEYTNLHLCRCTHTVHTVVCKHTQTAWQGCVCALLLHKANRPTHRFCSFSIHTVWTTVLTEISVNDHKHH